MLSKSLPPCIEVIQSTITKLISCGIPYSLLTIGVTAAFLVKNLRPLRLKYSQSIRTLPAFFALHTHFFLKNRSEPDQLASIFNAEDKLF